MRAAVLALAIFGILLAGCTGGVDDTANLGAQVVEGMPAEEGAPYNYMCTSSSGMHGEGQLTALYEEGALVGWRCTLDVHDVCTAPPDGKWTECTFEPPGWPDPVSEEFLKNPPPEERYEEREEEDWQEME